MANITNKTHWRLSIFVHMSSASVPHAFWNITDFGIKCPRCETINTITLEKGEQFLIETINHNRCELVKSRSTNLSMLS
jgi:hypothetical protein